MGLEGTVPELARKILGGAYRIEIEVETPKPAIEEALRQVPGVVNVAQLDSKGYEIETLSDLRADAAAAVVNSGGRLLRLDVESQSLDDIYTRYFEEVENDNNS
jgi:ABC-2 type transport system ATP-binding protein